METCEVNQSVVEVREWFDDQSTRAAVIAREEVEYQQLENEYFLWYQKNIHVNVHDWDNLEHPKGRDLALQRHSDYDNTSLAWVGAHWQDLVERYPNRWILVVNERVVADSESLDELREQAAKLRVECPFITKVGQRPTVWRTAYAGF